MAINKDILTGSFMAGLGIAMFVASYGIKDFAATGVGAGFMPRVTAVFLIALGGILLVETRRSISRSSATQSVVNPSIDKVVNEKQYFGGLAAVLLSFCLMGAFVGLLDKLGFILTSSVYIFFQMLILAKGIKKNYVLFGFIAIIASIITNSLFVYAFHVILPQGIFG